MNPTGERPKKAARGGNFDRTRSAPHKRPLPDKAGRPGTSPLRDIETERPGLSSRLVAARLLAAVVDAKTSLDALTDRDHGHPQFVGLEPRDQGLVKAILQTALRFRGSIEAALAERLERPLPKNATALRHILHVGAAQIVFLDLPDSAAVDLAVASAQADPRTSRFAALVNAVLRRLSRELAVGDGNEVRMEGARDCPAWLWDRLVVQYGADRAEAIAAAHRTPAPLDIAVKSDATGWAERLGGRLVGPRIVRIDRPDGPIGEFEGFANGEWWVQNLAASLPVRLFGDLTAKTAIDLCAAPGGKTAQLCLAGAAVTALDVSRSRMRRLHQNLTRLNLSAETIVADISDFAAASGYDAVLLDAPCSSTGTIRRHPDIAYTKDAAEIEKLAGVQARMVAQAAKLVAPGGLLVFSNCSLDRAEGEDVVAAFLQQQPDFVRQPIEPAELAGLEEAISPAGDLRTTPEMLAELGGLDGFYAARLRRRR